MKRWARGASAVLAALMLLSTVPITALAYQVASLGANDVAEEVTYNTGCMEVSVGYDVERWERIYSDDLVGENNPYAADADTDIFGNNSLYMADADTDILGDDSLDVWYDLFDENGGYTINLDLFETEPLFPYEVQFKYQGKTETRWFETVDDTVEVGGHVFALSCTDAQPKTIGFWIAGEYFPARPEDKTFTNDGGVGLFSMQPLPETRLTADFSSKLGSELKGITVAGGPTSGVWGVAGSDNYYTLGQGAAIDLSPYMGSKTVTLELIDGSDPLDPYLKRYIVNVKLCDVSKLLDFQAFVGAKAVTSSLYASTSYYWVSVTGWPKWSLEPATLKMKLGGGFSGYTADVYLGRFATEEAAKAADPSADITNQIWDGGSNPVGPGYGADYSKQPWFTVVFKNQGTTVYVYNARVYMYNDISSRMHQLLRNFDAKMTVNEAELELRSRSLYNSDTGIFVFYKETDQAVPQESSLKLGFSTAAGSSGLPKVTVYRGAYQTKEALASAIANGTAEDATQAIWGADAAGFTGNYTRPDQSPKFTLLLEQGDIPNDDWVGNTVLPVGAVVSTPSASVSINIGYGLYKDSGSYRSSVNNGSQDIKENDYATRTYSTIYILEPGNAVDGRYYANLDGYGLGESVTSSNMDKYITKAVVGRCGTADEVNDAAKADVKAQLFSSAYAGGGYAADYSKGVTFTVLDAYGQLHYATIRTAATPEPPAKQPDPLSDDTYFQVRGANAAQEGNPYQAYFMKSSDDGYYFNGYQTVFLLNDNGGAVTDATIYPTFWTGSQVNVYAALDTASGDKVESGKNPAAVTFGKPIHYSAGSESGTHLKNYWVTFVTQTAGGPNLFVNGATNSEHLDEASGLPVREIFLDAGHSYHHDIFFANIGDAQMTGLTVTLSADAQNIALDDYWQIKDTKSLGAFTTVDRTTSYGELSNVSKIRLVPKVVDGVVTAGEISGTLTISYDGGTPIVIKLTGTAAKPRITTTSIVPGVKYVHYSSVIQTDNMYNAAGVRFEISKGTLPNGLVLKQNGEIYGVPTVTGDYTVTVRALYNGAECDTKEFTLHIENNTDQNVWDATDPSYGITTAIPNENGSLTIDTMDKGDNSFANTTQQLVSKGEYTYFVELKLDGNLLEEGADYTKEPGSTRITLQTQTLKGAGGGSHTLSAEFREGDTMKRAAQNYEITPTQSGNTGGGTGGNTGGSIGGNPGSGITDPGTGTGTPGVRPAIPFTDVPKTAWYYSEVVWAHKNGYMVGVSDKKFEPQAAIGQATVVTVLARMAKVDLKRFDAEGYSNIMPNRWYSSAAVWATQAGLLPDDTAFVENGAISRGNMAIMLVKYLRSMGIDTSAPNPPVEFADADLMTAEENAAFQVLYRYGVFQGVGGMRMNPKGTTSRCEFSALLHRVDTLIKK